MNHQPHFLHGSLLQSKTIAGFSLSETAYPADSQIAAHLHDFAYFCFVLRGDFDETSGGQVRACRPSSLIFHIPHETHSDRFHTAARCFNVQLSDSFAERVKQFSAFKKASTELVGGWSGQIAAKIYHEFRHTDEISPLVIEGLMFELLGESLRSAKNKSELKTPFWLKQVFELLADCFNENLSLSVIAAIVGVHETHLAREFKRSYGCTVGEHLRRLRIEFACRKLSASSASLSEIALASGFADQSHFTKTFQRIMQMTPAVYRKISRGI